MANDIDFEQFDKIIDKIIDKLGGNQIYYESAKILLRKLKEKEKYNKQDWTALKIVLEDYIKRLEKN